MSGYVPNKVYDRAEIHAAAKLAGLPPGNATAGITTVGADLCVFWNPFRGLYANRWIKEPDEFVYSGEGSTGPMTYTGGNWQLKECHEQARPVPVFYKVKRTGSHWLHLGEFTVMEVIAGISRDKEQNLRDDIRFRFLRITQELISQPMPERPQLTPPAPPTEAELWALIAARTDKTGGKRRRATKTSRDRRVSDPVLTAYVLQRAIDNGGACESCGVAPGWLDDFGRPHFQAHHIDPDIDLTDWIGAVCGTCHDRLHHGSDRREQATLLRATVRARQLEAGRAIFDQR
ncbi:hypothetical protein [Paractinoplanes abujensis]|uniref:ScoMcrA-like SRA domain-containing protein n=1 Tax=Paractinoplanes abujensis TaxID=882441 RepID=A0A7W7G5Z0_9ACTN|nr:hypothetical protein [Actinoplanes abujensis]MBB4695411.1 hypothetical protein [Actinoplanes abujensis]